MVAFVKPLCDLFVLDFAGGRDPFLVYCFIYLIIGVAVLLQAINAGRKNKNFDEQEGAQ